MLDSARLTRRDIGTLVGDDLETAGAAVSVVAGCGEEAVLTVPAHLYSAQRREGRRRKSSLTLSSSPTCLPLPLILIEPNTFSIGVLGSKMESLDSKLASIQRAVYHFPDKILSWSI